MIKEFVMVQSMNGLLPTSSEEGTAKHDTSRLLHDINKLFLSLWLVFFHSASTHSLSCRGFAARAHTLAMFACLHGVSSVLTSWESSLVFSGLLRCTPK